VNITEAQFRELQQNISGARSAGERARKETTKSPKKSVYEGPLDITLILYGHCPSKKNGWKRGGAGKMYIPEEMKEQIESLTTQAMFGWSSALKSECAPVEHPDITVKFFVAAKRQDEDGQWTTILDCLQKAGVLLNDNYASFNSRKVHEPAEFVEVSEEKVEIRLVKR
jgi:hypothetical protein